MKMLMVIDEVVASPDQGRNPAMVKIQEKLPQQRGLKIKWSHDPRRIEHHVIQSLLPGSHDDALAFGLALVIKVSGMTDQRGGLVDQAGTRAGFQRMDATVIKETGRLRFFRIT